MAKSNKFRRNKRTGLIVALLAVIICGFCVLCSVQEKHGYDFGLPTFSLSSPIGWLESFFGSFGDGGALPVSGQARDTLEVHQIDVGQADCVLIIGPEKTVLIDAGENGQGDQVVRYLKKQGITCIDILIGTHPHSDHIGGMDAVIRSLDVGEVLLPPIPDYIFPTTRAFTDFLTAIDDKGLGVTTALPGDSYNLGGGATLSILGPLREYADLNNQSVIARVVYGNTSFLFTGDALKDAERDLLEKAHTLRSDVLSLAHHGSNTSTNKDFLQAVSPSIALISCGMDNNYGHPHREVIERLRETGARILRTDQNGTIVLISDGESIGVEVER